MDAAVRTDGGAQTRDVPTTYPDGAPVPGCNADGGIHCDGDWADNCSPRCAASQCCSPQHGHFTCAERDGAGRCPAADLFIDQPRIVSSVRPDWADFPTSDCAIVEGCVDAPGVRRILRFDTRTPNTGTADMYLGQPSMTNPNFTYSSCHNHYHFNTYASYELRHADGTVAARGHKQAFCLEDFERFASDAPAQAYTCSNQGIQMNWADVYYSGLPCQWIDITAVPAGDYVLHIDLNTAHILNELDYTNNSVDVPVHLDAMDPPNPDPRTACAVNGTGANRVCGWTFQGVHTCMPSTMVSVGCSAACGLGSCTGDTMLRVYDGDRTAMGSISFTAGMLVANDDSGCASGDLCSRAQFSCPASGVYSVLTGPYDSSQAATCTVATSP
jgi:hypothetical protein